MMVPYPMLKFWHFTRAVRSDDMILGLLNGNEKVKFFVIWKEIKNEKGTNKFIFGGSAGIVGSERVCVG